MPIDAKLSVDCRSNGEILVELTASKDYYNDYETIPDEQIVEDARAGDEQALEYLIYKYKNFVRAKARSYF